MENDQLIMLPGPTNVPGRVMRAMIRPIINHRGPEFRELYKRILDNAKYVFQTKGDVFALSASGTGSVECAVQNLISNGNKIAVTVNGVFSQRLKETVTAFGGSAVEIPVKWGSAASPSEIDSMLKTNAPVTALALVYNETSTGVTTPDLKEIGKVCHERGALFVVDAISILGGVELPIDEWGVDICIAGSQKCLMTPPGLSLISVNESAWDTVKRARRWNYFDLQLQKEFLAKYETPFTPALNLFYGLDEALIMIREEGLEKRFARHRVCAEAFYTGVESLGLEPYPEPRFRSRVVIAIRNPAGIDDAKIRETMRGRYHVIIAGGMGKLKGTMFRVGIMGSVSQFEVLATLSALESTLRDLGHQPRNAPVVMAREVFAKAN